MTKGKVCCEGGPVTAGCYHDNCTGPKEVKDGRKRKTKRRKDKV